ncbi:MAG: HEAT repeat domain-containing protein [Candidatus Sulfotelmatobacter sp.]
MAAKRAFEDQITALDALRQHPEEARVEPLHKALGHRNNFIVAKAADLVREFRLAKLTPDLFQAFARFFENPAKTDAQCWAKNALSRALAALEYQEAEVFLRGMRHIQMEPVWGGRSDTAGTLRATCALALVQCRSLTDADLLAHLLELLGDEDKAVRAEAARAIEQVGSSSASLLLRLRAVLGADEPEVLGACYRGILRIEGVSAIPWIGRFLATADDSAAEASLAIAGTHSFEGFSVLRESFGKADDPWWRSVLLSAIALTRQEEALEFLLDLVRTESLSADAAIEAVLRSMPSQEVIERLEKLVEGNPRLKHAFATHRPPS